MAFHDVAFAEEPQSFGPHRQGTKKRHVARHFVSRKVGVFVSQGPDNGMFVLAPPAFDSFERRAAGAVEKVVKKAERKWIHVAQPPFGDLRFCYWDEAGAGRE
jgi:hypothetical protein